MANVREIKDPRSLGSGEIGAMADGSWWGKDRRGRIGRFIFEISEIVRPIGGPGGRVVVPSANTPPGGFTGLDTDDLIEGTDNLYYTVDRAVNAGYAASAVGTDAYAITVTGIASLTVGDRFVFLADVANTGAATLQVNSLPTPAGALKKFHDQDVATGDIEAGQSVLVEWDGTNWQILSALASTNDHGLLSGLADDDHTIYALLLGRAGGQSLSGGDAANDDLTLQGTTHATRTTSYVLLQPNGGNVGILNSSPRYVLSIGADSGNLTPGAGANVATLFTSAAPSGFYIGQDATHNLGYYWNYNATPANAQAILFTYSLSNDIIIQSKNLRIETTQSTWANRVERMTVLANGNVGIGQTSPTARLHLAAGTATASTGPLKFTPAGAVLVTTPEAGLFEVIGDLVHYTIPTGPTRKTFAWIDQKLDDFGTPDDNTDLDASNGAHGLLPKLGGGSVNFLRADGTWNDPLTGLTATKNFTTAEGTHAVVISKGLITSWTITP